MQDFSWKQGVHSSVSDLYVQPLFPQKGESISVGIQIPLSEEIVEVRLVSFQLGREKQYGMQARREGRKQRYAISLPVRDDVMYWYFQIVALSLIHI